jgi:hypothetical protein
MQERFLSLASVLGEVEGSVLDLNKNSINFSGLLNRSGTE